MEPLSSENKTWIGEVFGYMKQAVNEQAGGREPGNSIH